MYLVIPGELLALDVFGFGLELNPEPLLFLSDCFFSGDGGSDSVLTQTNIVLSKRFTIVVLPLAVVSLASTLLDISFL